MSDERFAVQRTQITRVGRLRTALMLTDLVGYSRRMHADEANAVTELRTHYELVRKQLELHHGREVKTIGDAFLAEFPIADDALRCAVAIQSEMAKTFDGEDPLQVRIGLHVAEVEAIGPDVIGDGVNILSRIEPLAAPGGICCSKEFLDGCSARPVPFSAMGPVEVKNISSPIELFAWPAPSGRDAQSTAGDPEPTKFIRGPRSQTAMPAAAPGEDSPTVLHRSVEPTAVQGPTAPNVRPLSRSSGIFSPRVSQEAFPETKPQDAYPETSTVVVPEAGALLPEVPGARGQQATLDAPPSEDGTVTGPRPPERDPYEADLEPTGAVTGALHDVPEVRIPPPHKPRGVLIAVGSVAGVAVAGTLVLIGMMVGHAAKRTGPAPAETTVVNVPPPAPAPPPVAPAPAPAPVVVAPPAPKPAPVVEHRPEPSRAERLEELVARARHNLNADRHLKPRRRKQLVGELNKLESKWKHARAKAKPKAEKALRSFLKKHHLP